MINCSCKAKLFGLACNGCNHVSSSMKYSFYHHSNTLLLFGYNSACLIAYPSICLSSDLFVLFVFCLYVCLYCLFLCFFCPFFHCLLLFIYLISLSDARYVLDFTDHVWIEVWVPSLRR